MRVVLGLVLIGILFQIDFATATYECVNEDKWCSNGQNAFKGNLASVALCATACASPSTQTHFIYSKTACNVVNSVKNCQCFCQTPNGGTCTEATKTGYDLYKFKSGGVASQCGALQAPACTVDSTCCSEITIDVTSCDAQTMAKFTYNGVKYDLSGKYAQVCDVNGHASYQAYPKLTPVRYPFGGLPFRIFYVPANTVFDTAGKYVIDVHTYSTGGYFWGQASGLQGWARNVGTDTCPAPSSGTRDWSFGTDTTVASCLKVECSTFAPESSKIPAKPSSGCPTYTTETNGVCCCDGVADCCWNKCEQTLPPQHDILNSNRNCLDGLVDHEWTLDTTNKWWVAQQVGEGGTATHWGYENNNGPHEWGNYWPACAKVPSDQGYRQSPIDLPVSLLQPLTASHGPILFSDAYWTKTLQGDLTNNGHSLVFSPTGTEPGATAADFFIREGPYGDEKYQILQFHFHWGSTDYYGGEHTIDGRTFPLELHIVHINTKWAGDANTALTQQDPDGLAVLGIFFEIGNIRDEFANANVANGQSGSSRDVTFGDELAEIIAGVNTLINMGDDGGKNKNKASVTVDLGKILRGVIDTTGQSYLSYPGSLTTPACQEVVKWVNFLHPIRISSAQISPFRGLVAMENYEPHQLVSNRRNVQPLGSRTITYGN